MPVNRPRRIRVIIIIIIVLHRAQTALESNIENSVWEVSSNLLAQVQLLMAGTSEAAWTTEKELMDINTAFEALADYLESTDDPDEQAVEGLSNNLAAVL